MAGASGSSSVDVDLVLGHVEAGAEHEPEVVERGEPAGELVLVELVGPRGRLDRGQGGEAPLEQLVAHELLVLRSRSGSSWYAVGNSRRTLGSSVVTSSSSRSWSTRSASSSRSGSGSRRA